MIMSYNISSEKLNNPLLKELLQKLSLFFESKDLMFYVIGATARDIIMKQLLDKASARRTRDLDIAIALPDWDKYTEVAEGIVAMNDFKASTQQKQRFIYKEVYEVDMVPFGSVAKEDDCIYWPPEEDVSMSVKGFDDALKNALCVKIDGEFEIYVASLSSLFLLKLSAWADRNVTTSKDAEDLCFIIDHYFDAFADCYTDRDYHQEVYDLDDFDLFVAGAYWLAYDILDFLDVVKVNFFCDILTSELQMEHESRLIEQMMDASHDYDTVYDALSQMVRIFHEAINKK